MAKYYYKRYSAKNPYDISTLTCSMIARKDKTSKESTTYTDRVYLTPNRCAFPDESDSDYIYVPEEKINSMWDMKPYVKVNPNSGLYIEGLKRWINYGFEEVTGPDEVEISPKRPWTYAQIRSATEMRFFYSDAMYNGRNMQVLYLGTATISRVWKPDAYQGEVVAEDGTYPDDGYHSADGYYYVKDRLAIQFFAYIGGAWKVTETHVRVGGAWKTANVHPRLNGAWLG